MNLMDNAINACLNVTDSEQRWLHLTLDYEPPDDASRLPASPSAPPVQPGLRIQIANSCNTATEESKQRQPGHGFGTSIVQQTVTKYNGSYQVLKTPDSYQVLIEI